MTIQKHETDSIKPEAQHEAIDKNDNPSSAVKLKKRRKARIVHIEGPVQKSPEDRNTLNALFNRFSLLCIENSLPKRPIFTKEIENDFLLNLFLIKWAIKQDEYTEVIRFLNERRRLYQDLPDYHEYLVKLIESSTTKINELHAELEAIQQNIVKRMELLSVQTVSPADLLAAKNQLVCNFEIFILSLSLLRFDSSIYKQADGFKEQIQECLEDLQIRISESDLKLQTDSLRGLFKLAYLHVGVKLHIFDIKTATNPQFISYEEIKPLINTLFLPEENMPSQSRARKQLIACYDLAARLSHYPIYSIKKHELLHCCFHNHAELIHQKLEVGRKNLMQLSEQLEEPLARISGYKHLPVSDVSHANVLIDQIKTLLNEHYKDDKSMSGHAEAHQTEPRIPQLLELVQAQVEFIHRLMSMESTDDGLKRNVQACMTRLQEFYISERQFLVNRLKDAIQNAQSVAAIHTCAYLSLEIKSAGDLLNELLNSNPTMPLSALNVKISQKIDLLLGHINGFKDKLKVDWSTQIARVLEKKIEMPVCNLETSSSRIVMMLRTHNEPYPCPQLSPANPLQKGLQAATDECNASLNQEINHFARLPMTDGNGLDQWMGKMKDFHNQSLKHLAKRHTLLNNASLIERRLHSPAFKKSKQIVHLITQELIATLQSSKINYKDPSLINQFITNPSQLFDMKELSSDLKFYFERVSPVLLKLLMLVREFQMVNANYIHADVCLCSDDNYVPHLLVLVSKHLEQDVRDFYSRGINNVDGYVKWLQKNIYQPLLAHYVPNVVYELSPLTFEDELRFHDSISKKTSPAFFGAAPMTNNDAAPTKDKKIGL